VGPIKFTLQLEFRKYLNNMGVYAELTGIDPFSDGFDSSNLLKIFTMDWQIKRIVVSLFLTTSTYEKLTVNHSNPCYPKNFL